MKFEIYTPSSILSPYIKSYKLIESSEGMTNRILPGTTLNLAFRLRGLISYHHTGVTEILPATMISGLRKSPRLIGYAPDSAVIVVEFSEMGAACFFKEPLNHFFGQSVSVDGVFSASELSLLEEQLAGCLKTREKINCIEAFLISKLKITKADRLVQEAINHITGTNGHLRIHTLAQNLCVSQDVLEKRFRKIVGASPKQFSSIVKMNAFIRKPKNPESYLDMALENGFYDQAHFNRDFKNFTGLAPKEFFKEGKFW